MPTVGASAGYRGRDVGDDQGKLARLEQQLRCADVATTIQKLVDEHFGYRTAPAYLEREQQLTRLVVQGFSTIDIANHLVISVHTVQGHLRNIFTKTGVRTRRDLVTKIFFAHYEPASETTSSARLIAGHCVAGRLSRSAHTST